jgi:hypothetical protein
MYFEGWNFTVKPLPSAAFFSESICALHLQYHERMDRLQLIVFGPIVIAAAGRLQSIVINRGSRVAVVSLVAERKCCGRLDGHVDRTLVWRRGISVRYWPRRSKYVE